MNKLAKNKKLCPICGGVKKAGKTTYTVDPGFGVIVVRDVPVMICSQCSEEWIDDTRLKILKKSLMKHAERKHNLKLLH